MLDDSFYSYWTDLKNIQFLEKTTYHKTKSEIRRKIVEILSSGMVDETGKIRHLMNAEEIQTQLNERYELDVKKPSLYHHLKICEEIKLIQALAVKTPGRGKKFKAYYGRTAKIYLVDEPMEKSFDQISILQEESEQYEGLVKLIKGITPDVKEKKLISVFNSILQLNTKKSEKFKKWVESHHEIVSASNISLRDLFILLEFLKVLDPDVPKGVAEFLRMIDYK